MKYFGLIILLGILGFNIFNDFLLAPTSTLANLIQLRGIAEPRILKENGQEILEAKIYSTFPFNHRHLITVNAGTNYGVQAEMPVAVGGNFLLGQILGVAEKTAIVRTIYNKDFSLPVRLGTEGVNALLVGGQDPYLNLIDKNAEILEGDFVYSAGKDFPYGLAIGKIGAISDASTNSFKQAALELPYQINNLREVMILMDHVR